MLHAFTGGAFEDLWLFMWMLHAFTRCAFDDGSTMGIVYVTCYMHLLEVPLRCDIVYLNVTCITRGAFEDLWLHEFTRCAFEDLWLFMWMLHAFTRDVPLRCEIVYVNVTCFAFEDGRLFI
jgi:hypothetical protein